MNSPKVELLFLATIPFPSDQVFLKEKMQDFLIMLLKSLSMEVSYVLWTTQAETDSWNRLSVRLKSPEAPEDPGP